MIQDDDVASSGWGAPKGSDQQRATSPCSECKGALVLSTLSPGEELTIATTNSRYRLFLIDPGTARVLVKGGRRIGNLIETKLWGSFGGSSLCPGRVCIGQRLRFDRGKTCFVTSRVTKIERESGKVEGEPLDADLNDP